MLYFAATVASSEVLQLAILGPVTLTALFIGSTAFTEGMSRAKYPEYSVYSKAVGPSRVPQHRARRRRYRPPHRIVPRHHCHSFRSARATLMY